MSAVRQLASAVAYRMADEGDAGFLDLTGRESPSEARDLLRAYYHLLDTSKQLRAEMAAAKQSARDQVVAAVMEQRLENAIAGIHRYLSRVARRGGRGLPPLGERDGKPSMTARPAAVFVEPVQPASMAHGCAAPFAVGTAPALPVVRDGQRGRSASDITTPANPLFCDPAMQELQCGGDASLNAQGGTP